MDLSDMAVDPDVRKASTLPARFYTDPDVYSLTLNRLFASSWQFIGDFGLVKTPGAVHPFLFLEGSLNEPVLLTRDMQDELHLISNVCTHRGNLVCEGPGTERSLRCRYHGRRFELSGKFLSMPEFEGVENFPAPADDLTSLALDTWGPFLFGSIAPCGPFSRVMAPVEDRLGWLPFRDFRPAPELAKDYLVRTHWALYVDNYLEGFHIPYVHASLAKELNMDAYAYELYESANLQIGAAREGDRCFELPATSPDHGKRIAAYYLWIFPNTMLNFYPWGISVNVVKPLGPELTRVSFIPYIWRADLLGSGAGADLDRVEREDEAVIELVQKGVRSRFYNRGRYSPKHENTTHHFHRLIAAHLSD